ncbi:hypothetical protein NT6N_33930 [Oceaniferula spumae]|uniref:Uncharacterized protein n=1 Tax=Oceaniferula spumae TaxID=2979115 RepID=A0AAT9FQY8_9BACT
MVVFIQPARGILDAPLALSGLLQLPDVSHLVVTLLYSNLSGVLYRTLVSTHHFVVNKPPHDPT